MLLELRQVRPGGSRKPAGLEAPGGNSLACVSCSHPVLTRAGRHIIEYYRPQFTGLLGRFWCVPALTCPESRGCGLEAVLSAARASAGVPPSAEACGLRQGLAGDWAQLGKGRKDRRGRCLTVPARRLSHHCCTQSSADSRACCAQLVWPAAAQLQPARYSLGAMTGDCWSPARQ